MRLLGCMALFATGACAASTNISAVWANDGGDKVARGEIRATLHKENRTGKVINRTWNGQTITLFGARNEVISFNLVLEAANAAANNVTVSFNTLTGPNGSTIHSVPTTGNGVFSWVNRPIELFYVRYLPINGLSFFGYGKGDERQIPVRFQRPWTGNGVGQGLWQNRPDHDLMYPDILVPLEVVKQFNILATKSQSVWADIYIPKSAAPGVYQGTVIVQEGGVTTHTIPVQMTVYKFALPDTPTIKTMGVLDTMDVMQRYIAGAGGYVWWKSTAGLRVQTITDRYFELFHRHKLAVVGENECDVSNSQPCNSTVPRLNGSLFTAQNGYDGPGVGVGTGVFSIGTYGTWTTSWSPAATNESAMWQHADSFENWFNANSSYTERFLYLADEPTNTAQVETWAQWIKNDPGAGHNLLSMSTHHPVLARDDMPTLDVPVMIAGLGKCPYNKPPCDPTFTTQSAANFYSTTAGRRMWAYNDWRPATGSSEIEDDGIAMRTLPWAQYKKGIQRWFYWYVNQNAHKDWFQDPVTWGSVQFFDPSLGQFGNNGKSNGNGQLVYPGTDLYNPVDSYGVDGPFASLRLKEWRRGVQDVDYIALANKVNPSATQTVINNLIPKVLWEYPTQDPSYYVGPISWSSDPDVWEAARATLAQIIGP
jgi:glycosyl hydrolase family 123